MEISVPESLDEVDSDNDGLLDQWELNGFDADGDGVLDVDLPAMGVNPHRPDLLLEIDQMKSLSNAPSNAVFNAVIAMFANAPIINPNGPNGINLIVDRSGEVPYFDVVSFTGPHNSQSGVGNFFKLKTEYFDNKRRDDIFHYAIWGNMHPKGWSGESDVNFVSGEGGDDFIVSLDEFPSSYHSVRNLAATLAHELGHNLGFRHGGTDHGHYKPNYWSEMNYSWQLRLGKDDAWREAKQTCAPIYYNNPEAKEVEGKIPSDWSLRLRYSEGEGSTLNEAQLDEVVGVCGQPIDWNRNGAIDTGPVSHDINGDGSASGVFKDISNWQKIIFDGPPTDGRYGE